MTLHGKIENFIRTAHVAPTRFGRDVAGDPRLVFDLRRGRTMGPNLATRVEAYIDGAGQ